jgi:hypothetical protein
MDGLSLWLFASHLSKWAWSKEYCWHSKSVSYLDLHLEIDNGGRLTAKLYDERDDFTFQIANIPFVSSNIPASSAYGVYISQLIHYSRDCAQRSDFLDRVQLMTQKLSKQGCVARKWSHCCTNSTVVITIWLSVTKYPYLKWQWIFYFLRIFLLLSITAKTFTRLYIWVTRRVSYQKQELLTLRKHMSATRFLCGVFVAHLFSFSCSPIMSLYVLSYVLWCLLHFRIKTMFVLLYLHLL